MDGGGDPAGCDAVRPKPATMSSNKQAVLKLYRTLLKFGKQIRGENFRLLEPLTTSEWGTYNSASGSAGRFFRIRHESSNVHKSPPHRAWTKCTVGAVDDAMG